MKKSIAIVMCACLTLLFAACRDEFADWGEESGIPNTQSRVVEPVNKADNTGLILMKDGTWKASRRVPLTGIGRTIGNMSPGLVSVIGNSADLGPIVDNDLLNKASVAGAVTANALYGQIVSVKDMYRTYSGGQQAGFVYEAGKSGLLTAEVLKLFTLTLYNDGELVKTFNMSESGGVLGLNLINISTSNGEAQHTLSVDVPDNTKFDEIALGVSGVDASVLQALHIYYAFVGETPIRTTVKGTEGAYEKASIYNPKWSNWSNWIGQEGLVDKDESNGPMIELLNGLLNFVKGGNRVTVDFGEEIPAGSEVGFVYTSGDLLNLGLGNSILMETYPVNPEEGIGHKTAIEKYNVGSVLGASLIGGGKGANSFVVTKPFQCLYLNITGLRVNLGTTQYHYAYTRQPNEIDITAYFNFPEKMETTSSGISLAKPEKGKLREVRIVSAKGASAEYNPETSRITGMTQVGDYTVEFIFEYTDPATQKVSTFTQRSTITKVSSEPVASGCNQVIASGSVVTGVAEGEVLCVICGASKDHTHLVDNSLNTCMTYFSALELIGKQNIVTVQNIEGFSGDKTPQNDYRVGFVVQLNNEFLSLNALNFLYADLYYQGKKVEGKLSGSRPAVDLSLINGRQEKLRIGVKVEGGKPFDEIRLNNAGLASINFSSIRLYGMFYEPINEACTRSGALEACMEMVTPASNNAQISYKNTYFSGLANVAEGTYSLDNVLDDDKESFVTIPKTSVAGGFSLGVKFNQMPANQPIGMIIENKGGLANVNLLKAFVFEAYCQDEPVAKYAAGMDLLDVNVISHNDKTFLELQPSVPFDEIRLRDGEGLELLNQLKVFGVYTRTDADGNGIPDCGENDGENPEANPEGIYPKYTKLHVCNDQKNITLDVMGGKKGQIYVLKYKKYSSEMLDDNPEPEEKILNIEYTGERVIQLDEIAKDGAGVYLIDFYPSEKSSSTNFDNFMLYVHPTQTTWHGNGDTNSQNNWNHWKNWVEGAPWGCTDVVIPAGCDNYPVLDQNEDNLCARIQFESDGAGHTGEVVNTHNLTYDAAWVDLALKGIRPYLVSAPLQATYTGDVFALAADRYTTTARPIYTAANYTTAWPVLKNPADLAEGFRFKPQVYQHTFGGAVTNLTENGSEALLPESQNWTKAFNLVAQPYELGASFLVRMGKDNDHTEPTYRIRWPKCYRTYHYYEADNQTEVTGRQETINRSGAGRFIHEDSEGKTSFPIRLERRNERPGDLYLFGNPFMAHLSVKAFFETNVAVGEVWLLKENGYREIKREEAVATDQIAPMEGFVVKLRSPYAERNRYRCYVHLTQPMLEQHK